MMNRIWLALIVVGVTVGAVNGRMDAVSASILQAAIDSVNILLKLIGPMAFWLGVMKIAERSGFSQLVAKGIRPLMTRLFPEVPPHHPAMGAMVMNISANMLGLGNSATPLGIQAMKELQTLNTTPTRATCSMLTFLVINTACITLLPGTLIGYRVAAGSSEPTVIVATTLFATTVAAVVSLTVDRICRWIWKE